ncbi:hypothetical protein M3Y99_00896400 [Aphelenchoides fujianensis]|nr:hypothetical protein M3Y99_00896400 [Aphelenchoides fujianensis]
MSGEQFGATSTSQRAGGGPSGWNSPSLSLNGAARGSTRAETPSESSTSTAKRSARLSATQRVDYATSDRFTREEERAMRTGILRPSVARSQSRAAEPKAARAEPKAARAEPKVAGRPRQTARKSAGPSKRPHEFEQPTVATPTPKRPKARPTATKRMSSTNCPAPSTQTTANEQPAVVAVAAVIKEEVLPELVVEPVDAPVEPPAEPQGERTFAAERQEPLSREQTEQPPAPDRPPSVPVVFGESSRSAARTPAQAPARTGRSLPPAVPPVVPPIVAPKSQRITAATIFRRLLTYPPLFYFDYEHLGGTFGTIPLTYWLEADPCVCLLLRVRSAAPADVPLAPFFRQEATIEQPDGESRLLFFAKNLDEPPAAAIAASLEPRMSFERFVQRTLRPLTVESLLLFSDADKLVLDAQRKLPRNFKLF